jgi:hypothetical protein
LNPSPLPPGFEGNYRGCEHVNNVVDTGIIMHPTSKQLALEDIIVHNISHRTFHDRNSMKRDAVANMIYLLHSLFYQRILSTDPSRGYDHIDVVKLMVRRIASTLLVSPRLAAHYCCNKHHSVTPRVFAETVVAWIQQLSFPNFLLL